MADSELDLSGARILAVDDVPSNLDVLYLALGDTQYQVQVASSGEQALAIAVESIPDLILLDVMMPGIDGFETCRRLKQEASTRDIPVIFLTALGEMDEMVEGFQAGGVDYVTKPFQKEEVLVRIRTHLTLARLARELAEKNEALEAFNTRLGEMVDQRTRELRRKVTELEGKDRIAQHLLAYHHTLEETLELVLEVIVEVMALDRAVVYLEAEGQFKPAAAVLAPGVMADSVDLGRLEISDRHRQAFERVREEKDTVRMPTVEGAPFALAPILRDGNLLGMIEAVGGTITAEAAQTLSSFALQAAVAISDSQVQQDVSRLITQIDDALELDEMLDYVDPVEDPDRGYELEGSVVIPTAGLVKIQSPPALSIK